MKARAKIFFCSGNNSTLHITSVPVCILSLYVLSYRRLLMLKIKHLTNYPFIIQNRATKYSHQEENHLLMDCTKDPILQTIDTASAHEHQHIQQTYNLYLFHPPNT